MTGPTTRRTLAIKRLLASKRPQQELLASLEAIDTSSRAAVGEWGVADGVFVDGKSLQNGPPPSYEAIHRAIGKRVARL